MSGSDDVENLVTCCMPCNLSKSNKTPEEWGSRS
jgi:5-methylcytosine-specific restriction endonuclease McrA